VRPPERPEAAGIRALRPDGDAGHAERAPRLDPRAVERRWIGLDGRLAWPEVERVPERLGERGDLVGLEEARRSATEVQRVYTRPAERRPLARDLLFQGDEIAAAKRRRRWSCREIAIGAT